VRGTETCHNASAEPLARLATSVGGLSIDKNVTVVEFWFYTAAETTDYGSVSTDRDSARLAINAAQESPWGRSKRGPGAFPFTGLNVQGHVSADHRIISLALYNFARKRGVAYLR